MRDRFPLLIAEGNKPGVPHTPLASACCSGIVTATVTTTTPSNASAATTAIIAIEIVFSSTRDEPTILFLYKNKQRLNALIKIGLTRVL